MGKEYWDGRFETSRNNTSSLEEDLYNCAVYGDVSARPLSDGGTERVQLDGNGVAGLHIYYPSDDPKGHDHLGVDSNGRSWGF